VALAAIALLASACLDRVTAPADSPATPASAAIVAENQKAGSAAWTAALRAWPESTLAGYALPISLAAGDSLHLFVRAQGAPVSIAIYRLGWYGGAGARLVAEHRSRPVAPQPACSAATPGPAVCDWSETDRFLVDPTWLPGVYTAVITDALKRARAFPFVVRSPHPAAFVVVLPFATYQAYNHWGGTSLYGGPGATRPASYASRAHKVSFARPLSESVVADKMITTDYSLVRWLEQSGYDVSYITDFDFDKGRGANPQAVAWLFAGHSEYWTWSMWLRAKAARDQGISLGFLGGNDVYWVARFESVSVHGLDAPVVVCYREAALDPQGSVPGLATVRFRTAPNNTPENELVGVMSLYRGAMSTSPVDLVVANGSDPLFAGTGLHTGEHIPRVAGWEGDRVVDNGKTPLGIRVLFDSPYVPLGGTAATERIQSTVYRWPASGALVYASGEPGFAWGLSDFGRNVGRPPLQHFMRNLFAAFVAAKSHH
jgi:hypothetical protein